MQSFVFLVSMRIRKHASKLLGAALSCHSSPPSQPSLIWPGESAGSRQLCPLDRSPWDITPSPPPSPNSYIRADLQYAVLDDGIKIEEEQPQSSRINNGIASAIDSAEKDNKVDNYKKKVVLCRKSDGKKWNCKRLALNHHPFCDYHLNQLRSHKGHNKSKPSVMNGIIPISAAATNTGTKVVKAASGGVGGAPTAADRSSFYYCARFGPCSRSKRRGGKSIVDEMQTANEGGNSELQEEDKQLRYRFAINGDGVEEDRSENEKAKKSCSVKRRGRKRVKARSLRSLMW